MNLYYVVENISIRKIIWIILYKAWESQVEILNNFEKLLIKTETMNDEPSLMVLRNGKKVLFIDQRVSRTSKTGSGSSHCSSIGRKTPDKNSNDGDEPTFRIQKALQVKWSVIAHRRESVIS